MEYQNDKRETTIAEIERILIETYGKDSPDSGCYHNGKWLSISAIMQALSDNL